MIRAMQLIAALALAAAIPLAAAEEPEAAYAKYHRAAASGNVDEMAQYASAAQRADLAGMSKAQKDAQATMAAATMPRAYLLRRKALAANGRAATLVLAGTGPALVAGRPETLYGTVKMVMEGGAWKVADTSWTNQEPANLAPAASPAKAAPARAAPVVGSMESAPVRKLGKQKPPCEFKPVMTAEDLENCK